MHLLHYLFTITLVLIHIVCTHKQDLFPFIRIYYTLFNRVFLFNVPNRLHA